MEYGSILCFSAIFPGVKIPDLGFFLSNAPSKLYLQYIGYAINQIHREVRDDDIQKDLLNSLLKRQSPELQKLIQDKIKEEKKRNKNTIIFDVYPLLKVSNYLIQNFSLKEQYDSTPIDELKLLLSILVASEDMNKSKFKTDGSPLELYCSFSWPLFLMSTELRIPRNFITYSYRCLELLDYIKSVPELLNAINEWSWMNVESTTHTYFHKVFEFYRSGLKKETGTLYFSFSTDLSKFNPIIDKLTLDLRDGLKDKYQAADFKSLRERPIIRIKDEQYIVLNWNFVLEKLYNGLLFDLFYTTSLKEKYFIKGKYRFDSFKGKIGYDFSEKFISKLISESIGKHADAFQLGDPNGENIQDIYIRKRNHICLLEYKDVLAVKHFDYEKIKTQVDTKLVHDHGVKQIVELLKRLVVDIRTFEASFTKETTTKTLEIYPMIVVSDLGFLLPGITDYLDYEFQKAMQELSTSSTFLKPTFDIPELILHSLIIIDDEFFMNHYDAFASGNADFFEVLNSFYKQKLKDITDAKIDRKDIKKSFKQYSGFSDYNLVEINQRNKDQFDKENTFLSLVKAKLKRTEEELKKAEG